MLNVKEKVDVKMGLAAVSVGYARADAMDRAHDWHGSINGAGHILAAFWLFALAILITLDVASRALLNAPFTGTAEIVANSVVSIVFLQLPSAVRSGGMLRAEVLDAFMSDAFRRNVQRVASVLGAVLFLADAVMQRLLVMGARTCYLHAALHAALPPQVEAQLNGVPLELG